MKFKDYVKYGKNLLNFYKTIDHNYQFKEEVERLLRELINEGLELKYYSAVCQIEIVLWLYKYKFISLHQTRANWNKYLYKPRFYLTEAVSEEFLDELVSAGECIQVSCSDHALNLEIDFKQIDNPREFMSWLKHVLHRRELSIRKKHKELYG